MRARVCVRVCASACARACVRECVCACACARVRVPVLKGACACACARGARVRRAPWLTEESTTMLDTASSAASSTESVTSFEHARDPHRVVETVWASRRKA
eukprot:2138723-Pleurochrysis_carterae.AAC.1